MIINYKPKIDRIGATGVVFAAARRYNEEGAEAEGKALNQPLSLCSCPHRWS